MAWAISLIFKFAIGWLRQPQRSVSTASDQAQTSAQKATTGREAD